MSNTAPLNITIAQVNPTVGDIAGNTALILKNWDVADKNGADLVIFPEMVICGYPAEDLLLKPAFLKHGTDAINDIVAKSKNLKSAALIGTPWIADGKTYNAALLIENGKILAKIYKKHLPNYGVFDEPRIFASNNDITLTHFRGHDLGIMICEDMWFPDVAKTLSDEGVQSLIVINASPFYHGKNETRLNHARARVSENTIPLIYAHMVGGQDDLVFDGQSFAINKNSDIVAQSPHFDEHHLDLTLHFDGKVEPWGKSTPPLTLNNFEVLYKALVTGVRDYVHKNGFKDVFIGLSGGVDSALTAVIAADALGADHVKCIMMPSQYTADMSLEDADTLAHNLGVTLDTIAIDDIVKTLDHSIENTLNTGDIPPITFENIQSRARGVLLMAMSNATGAMVLTTGNKSEMAVGYATLYGDMCGGFNPLKDLYKTQVYELCHWRNKYEFGEHIKGLNIIPQRILTRAPSAELRADQTDQDSLPDYDILDAILQLYIEQNLSISDAVEKGYDRDVAERVWTLLHRAEYKRNQSAPGVKVTSRAFGKDRRYPITNKFKG